METTKGLELAQQMGDFVNTFNMRERSAEFIEGFDRQHRTLQQSSFRMVLELIEHIASPEYRVDGRNEHSHRVAKMLLKGFEMANHEELRKQGVSEKEVELSVGDYWKPSKFLGFI